MARLFGADQSIAVTNATGRFGLWAKKAVNASESKPKENEHPKSFAFILHYTLVMLGVEQISDNTSLKSRVEMDRAGAAEKDGSEKSCVPLCNVCNCGIGTRERGEPRLTDFSDIQAVTYLNAKRDRD